MPILTRPILPSKWSIPTLFSLFSFCFYIGMCMLLFFDFDFEGHCPPPSLRRWPLGIAGRDVGWTESILDSPFFFPMCFFLFPGWSPHGAFDPPPPFPSLSNSLLLDTPHFAISNSKNTKKRNRTIINQGKEGKKKEVYRGGGISHHARTHAHTRLSLGRQPCARTLARMPNKERKNKKKQKVSHHLAKKKAKKD